MKFPRWLALPIVLALGAFVWAADDALQENEKQILGEWQVGKAVVAFLPEGKVHILEEGVPKEGAYEITGDWLFVRSEGEDEKSGLLLIDGDRMTVDEHEFRRLRPLNPEDLVGKWTSDKVDIDLRADGTLRLVEKTGDKGKSGTLEIVGNELRLTEEGGKIEVKPFVIEGDTLVVDGTERLSRIGETGDPQSPLVGMWQHGSGAVVTLTAEGGFTRTGGKTREGTYTLAGSTVSVKTLEGEVRGFSAALEDGALVLDGKHRLTRSEGSDPGEVASTAEEDAPLPISTPLRYDGALNEFLEARKSLVLMAADGLGAQHPDAMRAIRETRFLLKRCHEEADLLGASAEARGEIGKRLEYYGEAVEKELAEWGSR